MVARKKMCFMEVAHDATLLQRTVGTATSASQVAIVRDDFHLIEAAVATDYTVVSLDDNARAAFRTAVASVKEFKDVVWANPDSDTAVKWLENGAKPDKQYLLGSP